jgi:hypothetical protein
MVTEGAYRYRPRMAKCFTEWTVLPHDPIEKVADNLWRVQGTMNDGKIQRQMVLARMKDGRVIVHNAIALNDADMKQLEAWGKPSVLFVPNSFHRQDALIWKKRYPDITVVAPAGSKKGVAKVVPVDATIEDAPGDDTVRLKTLAGAPAEGILEVKSGNDLTAVFCDAILNMKKTGGVFGIMLAPTGRVSVPRISRLMVLKNKRAFANQIEALAGAPGLRRLMFAHGKPVDTDPAGALRGVVEQLT